ncbi:MAG: magnesium-dependent phosphatase-1, partial [Verrucomicrobiae bacterium]|nr:magnesium-dependent phosphatase-1 [Verrucomicrobiae bacterium]
MKQPAVIVFDLDFTLWDCGGTWCDCLWPPFRKAGSRVLDAHDSHVRLYPDVQEILD